MHVIVFRGLKLMFRGGGPTCAHYQIHTGIYRIAGKFRGVKNSFNSRKGGFRE